MSGCRPMIEKGLACPYCGEHLLRVARTIAADGSVLRHRKCQACGLSHKTEEKPVNCAARVKAE